MRREKLAKLAATQEAFKAQLRKWRPELLNRSERKRFCVFHRGDKYQRPNGAWICRACARTHRNIWRKLNLEAARKQDVIRSVRYQIRHGLRKKAA